MLSLVAPSAARAQSSEHTAGAAFRRAESEHDFRSFEIAPLGWGAVGGYAEYVAAAISDAVRRASVAADRYSSVLALGSARWSIAALVAQGRIYDTLAGGMRSLSPPPGIGREALRRAIEVVRQRLPPAECDAIRRYSLATRVARSHWLDTEESRAAHGRLRSYGHHRVLQCVTPHGRGRPSFAPHDRRNPSRAPRALSSRWIVRPAAP